MFWCIHTQNTYSPIIKVIDNPVTNSTTSPAPAETPNNTNSSLSTEEASRAALPSGASGQNTDTATEEASRAALPSGATGDTDTAAEEASHAPLPSGATGQDTDTALDTSGANGDGMDVDVDTPDPSDQDMGVAIVPFDGDPPEPGNQNMDVDIVPSDGESNMMGSLLQSDGENGEGTPSSVAQVTGGGGDVVVEQSTQVAKEMANAKPVRYLDGKRVSEYEWERSKTIEQNKVVLVQLGLENAGRRIFGKEATKGKENRKIDEPSKKRGRKTPSTNVDKRTLRSSAVPNTSVSFVVYK